MSSMNDTTFYYRYIERSGVWRAVYTSPKGDKLELLIDLVGIHWLVTPKEYPEKGNLRELLLKAVARMKVDLASKSVLDGVWEVCTEMRYSYRERMRGVERTGDRM